MVVFEWDETMASSYYRKHRIRFEDAIEIFCDPHALTEPERIADGELRWQTIGVSGGAIVLLVAHTVRDESVDEIIRVLARRADRKERRRYEQNRKEELG